MSPLSWCVLGRPVSCTLWKVGGQGRSPPLSPPLLLAPGRLRLHSPVLFSFSAGPPPVPSRVTCCAPGTLELPPSWGAVSSCGLVVRPLGIGSFVLAACVCALPAGLSEPQLFICKMDARPGPRWLQGKAVRCVSLMASFRGAACGQSLPVSPVWVGSGQRTGGRVSSDRANRTVKQRRSCCCHGRGADAGKRAAPALSSTRGALPRPLVWAPAAQLGPASWPLGGGAREPGAGCSRSRAPVPHRRGNRTLELQSNCLPQQRNEREMEQKAAK